jgi:hypothetical protein
MAIQQVVLLGAILTMILLWGMMNDEKWLL